MKNIGIIGISGRIGQSLYHQCAEHNTYHCPGGYDRSKPVQGSLFTSLKDLFAACDYVVDFSSPDLMTAIIDACLSHPKPLVIGTTGHTSLRDKVKALAQEVPVIIAPNTSLGACLHRHLVKQIARFLPENYDIDILERHHRQKKDHPSGTALALADVIKEEKERLGQTYISVLPCSPRSSQTIQITSLRSGQTPGEHEVTATSAYESITIIHKAFEKDFFAQCVFSALEWLEIKKPLPGIYCMEDVLGF